MQDKRIALVTGANQEVGFQIAKELVESGLSLESTAIMVNLVSPGFTKTNLNTYEGTQSVAAGSREVVRVALLGPDGATGTYTRWENETIPW